MSFRRAGLDPNVIQCRDGRDGVEKQVEVVAIDRSVQPPSFAIRVDGRERETEAHRLSLDPSLGGKMINVTVKVIWPEVVASEFKRGERGREAALEVAVGPDATVSAVKAIVQEREDVPLERQQLVFGGGLQEDARTLASIGVADGHTLFVTVMSGVNVFVKELDGTQHTINIRLSDSVAALKAQMGKLKGWGADAIKLVCAGKLLAPDSASLSSLHVQKEMTIFVIKVKDEVALPLPPLCRFPAPFFHHYASLHLCFTAPILPRPLHRSTFLFGMRMFALAFFCPASDARLAPVFGPGVRRVGHQKVPAGRGHLGGQLGL
jgi:hypothetical protein